MWIPSIFKSDKGAANRPEILVITVDDKLYYALFSVSIDIGWTIRRARTAEGAWRDLRSNPAAIVVYDARLPSGDWQDDLRSFSTFPRRPLVFLAAPEVDEEVWRTVLRCNGYDAVKRSAGVREWMRALRFAWLSRCAEERDNAEPACADARIGANSGASASV
jgi:DNA-binding response OmpR family regulator